MIPLHRLTHPEHPLYLNPDHIQTVEANPDTVIALANASKFVVRETPDEVTDAIRTWKASILARAFASGEADVVDAVGLLRANGANGAERA